MSAPDLNQQRSDAQAAKPGWPVAGMEGGGKQSQKHTGKQIPPQEFKSQEFQQARMQIACIPNFWH